jgi:hypothetical protein
MGYIPPHIEYKLSDGTVVTARMVADEVGISIVSSRTRLLKSDNPKIVFAKKRTAKYINRMGPKPRPKVEKYYNDLWNEQPMVRLMMRAI